MPLIEQTIQYRTPAFYDDILLVYVGTSELLQYAGLRGFFEQALSADPAKRLKPAREAYRLAAERLGIEPANLRLVATHAWDVTGAIRRLRSRVRHQARHGS